MHTLRIAIDPLLRERYGPEICWALRTLCGALGYAWEETQIGDPRCDLAYAAGAAQAEGARLWVRASSLRWARPAAWTMTGVARGPACAHPIYSDEESEPLRWLPAQGGALAERDLIFDLFWLLTGQEEAQHPRNRHGYLQLEGTPWVGERALRLALASDIVAAFGAALAELGTPPPLPRWPHGRRAAAAISHDVDYPEVIRWLEPLRQIARRGAPALAPALDLALGRRHHWQFGRWMELEQRLGARSAFYFVARQGSLLEYARGTPDSFYDIGRPAFRALFRELADAGWEIGLHGSYHAYASPEQFAAEKRRLEQASGQSIAGHRHHYWHLDPRCPEATLLLHEQIGLRYDASLTNDHYVGWRRGSCLPFFPFHQGQRRELGTLQLPTGWMDDQLFGQAARNPGDRGEILRDLAATVGRQGGVLLVDIHEYVLDDALYPGWAQALADLWESLGRSGDFWLATPGQIAQHWADRYQTIMRASYGLSAGSMTGAHTALHPRLPLAAGA